MYIITFVARLRTAITVSFTATFRLAGLPRNNKQLRPVYYVIAYNGTFVLVKISLSDEKPNAT
jgi:hypothetical protein